MLDEREERAIHSQEHTGQLLSHLIELAHDAILVRDPASVISSWNRGAEELYGWTAQEACGQVTHRLLHTYFPESREALDTILATGERWQGELVHTRRDGTHIIVESRQVMVRNEQGKPAAILEINRDITEQKQRERTNQEQYQTIVRTANEGIWLIDAQAQTIFVNERCAEMLGYTIEEIAGHTLLDFVFPEDEPAGRVHIDNNLQGRFEQFDFRFRRKDGTSLYTLACTNPVRNGEGAIVAALGMFTDVTERKHAEEQEHFLAEVNKVLASSLDYQQTLATIAQLVVPQLADWFTVDLVDAEGQFELIEIDHTDPDKVQWARALRERYPIDPTATAGAPQVVRTGRSELYPDISDELLVASAHTEEELAIARMIGYTSIMIVPLVARGQTIGVVTFVSAESGRKYDERDVALAEEVGRRAGIAIDNARLYREVGQARDQLEIILQGVADGIIVYENDRKVIYANEAAARLTGFPSIAAMLHTSSADILAQFTIVDENMQPFSPSLLPHRRVLAGEREAQAIIGYGGASATKTFQPDRWMNVTSRPVLNEQGTVLFAITILHDITERVLAEHRKDEFISMASHELKTPVTSLKGFSYVLQRRLTKQGDEQSLQYLSRMDAQILKLTKLISELLDISRMQSGKLAFQQELFDLDTLVQETMATVQAATASHQLQIEGKAEAQVLGDKDHLGQVFINLLTNAIKYSPKADTVLIHLSKNQEQAVVSVQDFGIGISEPHHQKIFERFYQVTDPEERTYPGLGIGLYISHEIVERHHGRMWVESSKKGHGSTFSVALPLSKEL